MYTKLKTAIVNALLDPAVQAQIASAAVALTSAFGFHLPATDVAALVAGAEALLALWLHVAIPAAGARAAKK